MFGIDVVGNLKCFLSVEVRPRSLSDRTLIEIEKKLNLYTYPFTQKGMLPHQHLSLSLSNNFKYPLKNFNKLVK